MPFSPMTITLSPRPQAHEYDNLVQISKQLVNRLKINLSSAIKLYLGKMEIIASVQTLDTKTDVIYIPEHFFLKFNLPLRTYRFKAKYDPEQNTLQLGPIVALLTNFPITEKEELHFRSIHKFCEELHQEIAEQGGFFYVFSFRQFPDKGYYFENGKWLATQLPLPDVIYNRIHSRRLELSNSFSQFRNSLEQLMIPLFNDRFLSKWEVYEQVSEEHELLPSIPETKFFSKEHFYDLAQKYDMVFIKPVHGSQGRNIIKLFQKGENQYILQSSAGDEMHIPEKPVHLEEMYQQIKPLLQNRIYLIQQGIRFVTKDGCAVDFRVLCHKNDWHRWEITSIVARIGATGEFVSNIARGGVTMNPLKALRTWLDKQTALKVLSSIKKLALDTAQAVSCRSPGITGELGIDIGVDAQWKPWLIEVNSKPSKVFEETQGKIRPSAKAISRFCTMLAFHSIYDQEVG